MGNNMKKQQLHGSLLFWLFEQKGLFGECFKEDPTPIRLGYL